MRPWWSPAGRYRVPTGVTAAGRPEAWWSPPGRYRCRLAAGERALVEPARALGGCPSSRSNPPRSSSSTAPTIHQQDLVESGRTVPGADRGDGRRQALDLVESARTVPGTDRGADRPDATK